jgi:hypothetical protein
MDLTNEQCEVREPLIPDPVRQADGRGRSWRDSRDVLNSILWFCVPALLGATCQNATRLTRPATDASSGGTRKVCWMRFFEHWSKT